MVYNMDCYHGTSHTNTASIINNGFRPSDGDNEWLGDGIYTFIDRGLKNPIEAAEQWSEFRARKSKYQFGAVLQLNASADENDIIDLNTEDGIKYLEFLEKKFKDKLREVGKSIKSLEGVLINFGRNELGYSSRLVIGNFYIQLSQEQLNLHLHQRTPNCTICCIHDPGCIDQSSIKEIKQWRIKYEVR